MDVGWPTRPTNRARSEIYVDSFPTPGPRAADQRRRRRSAMARRRRRAVLPPWQRSARRESHRRGATRGASSERLFELPTDVRAYDVTATASDFCERSDCRHRATAADGAGQRPESDYDSRHDPTAIGGARLPWCCLGAGSMLAVRRYDVSSAERRGRVRRVRSTGARRSRSTRSRGRLPRGRHRQPRRDVERRHHRRRSRRAGRRLARHARRRVGAARGAQGDHPKPIRFVVNSHYHFDHSHGNQIYGPEVEIIGHEFARADDRGRQVASTRPRTTSSSAAFRTRSRRWRSGSRRRPTKEKATIEQSARRPAQPPRRHQRRSSRRRPRDADAAR